MAGTLSASGRHGNIVKGGSDENWILLQQKAFTAWVNQHLSSSGILIKDLVDELKDGGTSLTVVRADISVNICTLVEKLAKTPLKKWSRKPKTRFECLENVSAAFDMLKRQSVKLAAIGPEDLVDPKQKLILGLIWLLILRYHLSSGGDVKGQMMKWVREMISGFGLDCKDLTASSWGDGRVYVGIVHAMKPVPGITNPAILTGDPLENVRKAMVFAESELDVPHVLDPEDILAPEELSMLTYLGFFRNKTEELKNATPPTVDVQAAGDGIAKATVGTSARFVLTVQVEAPKAQTTPRSAAPSAVVLSPDLALSCEAAFKATDKDSSGSVSLDELITVLEKLLEGRVAPDKIRKVAVGQLLAIKGDTSVDLHQAEFASIFAALAEYFPAPDVLNAAIKSMKDAPLTTSTRSLSLSQSMHHTPRDSSVNFAGMGFKLDISAPDSAVVTCIVNPGLVPNSFNVEYEARVPGPHQIAVSYKGTKVKSWTAEAVLGGPTADQSSAEGEGLATAVVGLPALFTVQLRDAKGASLDCSTALSVLISGAAPSVKATGTSVGHHEISYVAANEGAVPIIVKVGGVDVKGSPFSANAQRATGKLVAVKSVGLSGKPFDFSIQTKLPGGATACSLAPVLQVTADGASINSKEGADGLYEFTHVPTGAVLKLEAALAGQAVTGSPLELQIVSLDKSKLSGPEGPQRVGKAVQLSVSTVDANDAGVSTLPLLAAKIGDDAITDLRESKPGDIIFSVSPKTAGKYEVIANVDGAPLHGSPYTLQMMPSISAKHSTFALQGDAIANALVTVYVTACDSEGKAVEAEGEKCEVSTEAKEQFATKYIGKGIFEASSTSATPVTLRLFASLNGEAVPPAPLEVVVKSAALAAASRAEGPGLSASEPGLPATFSVHACDANGKQVAYGGDKVRAWLVSPSGDRVEVEIQDDGNGGYKASYVLSSGGAWALHVALNGKEINDSPFAVQAIAVPDASKSSATGEGLSKAVVGVEAAFQVQLCDITGAPLDAQDCLAITIADSSPAVTKSKAAGLYDVAYVPSKEGPTQIDVKVAGAAIKGSPFTANAQHASAWLVASKPISVTGKPFDFIVDTKLPAGVSARSLAPALKVSVNGSPVTGKADENGVYAFTMTPSDKDSNLKMEATLAGEPVQGTPVQVAIVSVEKSKLRGPEGAQRIGSAVLFTVSLSDVSGVPVSAGGLLVAKFSKDTVGDLKEDKAGHSTFSVSPNAAGTYTVTAEVDGMALHGSPYTLHMVSAVAAKHSTFALKGDAIAAAPVTVRVTAHDADGKEVEAEHEKCTITTDKNEELATKYIGKGVFEASTTTATPMTLHLFAKLNGKVVSPAPLEVNVKSAASAAASRAEGPGLSVAAPGVPATFAVHACDANGKQVPYNDKVTAWLMSSDGKRVEVDIQDDGNGGYKASYVLPSGGAWALHVALNGEEINDSPFAVQAIAVPDASKSSATGEGLSKAIVGVAAAFQVQLCDATGAPVDVQSSLAVQVAGSTAEIAPAMSESAGLYSVSYVVSKEGPTQIDVKIAGAEIKGSPFTANAQHASAKLFAGKHVGVVGKPFDFTVETRLPAGISARSLMSALAVTVNGTPAIGKENTEGIHAFSTIPSGKDSHLNIAATLAGKPIAGSPLSLNVVSLEKSKLSGPDGAQRVGLAVSFTVHLRDASGNPVPAGDLLVAKLGKDTITDLKENEAGHSFSVSPKAAGTYSVTAEVDGVTLHGSPHALQMVSAISAEHSTFELKGDAVVNHPVAVHVAVRDADGKEVEAEHEKCTITTDKDEELTTKYLGKGVFEATTSIAAPTTLRLFAALNDAVVPPAPLEVLVMSAASAVSSRAAGPGLSASEPGLPATFSVHACDANGKQVAYGGDKVRAWLVSPSGDRVEVEIQDDGNGGYKASYVLSSGGAWALHVALNGKEINDSPFAVQATAVADPSKCRAFGLGLKHATVGKRATFCVELFSRAGKPIGIPPAVKAAGVSETDVVALGDGMFDVSYKPTKEGSLKVEVLTCQDGLHVHKSPFDVNVLPSTRRVRLWTLLVSCADELGNLQPSMPVEVSVIGPDGKKVQASVTRDGGTCKLEIEPHMRGNYFVSVTANGEHVTGSPFCAEHV